MPDQCSVNVPSVAPEKIDPSEELTPVSHDVALHTVGEPLHVRTAFAFVRRTSPPGRAPGAIGGAGGVGVPGKKPYSRNAGWAAWK